MPTSTTAPAQKATRKGGGGKTTSTGGTARPAAPPVILRYPHVETYQLVASNGRPIRKATRVRLTRHLIIDLLDLVPSKQKAVAAARFEVERAGLTG
jgi:hypothetical protein